LSGLDQGKTSHRDDDLPLDPFVSDVPDILTSETKSVSSRHTMGGLETHPRSPGGLKRLTRGWNMMSGYLDVDSII